MKPGGLYKGDPPPIAPGYPVRQWTPEEVEAYQRRVRELRDELNDREDDGES